MQTYYSATTRGFYREGVHDDLPEDAQPISDEQHQALMEAQTRGCVIGPDPDGWPVAMDPPTLTREQLASQLQRVVSNRLEAEARSLGYDSLASAISYAEDSNAGPWQAEGRALRAWRTRVWQVALTLINADELPTPEALLAALPGLPYAEAK